MESPVMEFKVVKAKKDLQFNTRTRWRQRDYDDYVAGDVTVTVNEEMHFSHPSGDCEIVMDAGSKFVFAVYGDTYDRDDPDNKSKELHLIVEEARAINGAWECMGKVYPRITCAKLHPTAQDIRRLVVRAIDILLMHAVNYDGTESSLLSIAEATSHYREFGIHYEQHSVERARCF